MKKVLAILLIIALVFPPASLAHLGEESSEEIYTVDVSITGLSLEDDLNFFFVGNADVLFDYVVEPRNQIHTTKTGITSESKSIGDNQSITFPPIQIYEHEICGCNQDFDLTIDALDYSPWQFFALDAFFDGLDLGESFLTGGTTGLSIAIIGKVVNHLIDYFQTLGLTEEQAQELAESKLREDSEFLGRMEDSPSTGCDPLEETFTSPLLLEERANGDITYKVSKKPTGELCGSNEETGANTAPNPQPTDVSDGVPDPQPTEEDKPECLPSTGKVLLNGEYHCPTSSVPAGEGCECLPGYEWAYPNNLCAGCTKTDKDKCLAATKKAIDWATGSLEPNLMFVGETQIRWDLGQVSCKNAPAATQDYTENLNMYIPQVNEECTNLKLLEGRQYTPTSGGCGMEFFFQYKEPQ